MLVHLKLAPIDFFPPPHVEKKKRTNTFLGVGSLVKTSTNTTCAGFFKELTHIYNIL